MQTESLSLKTIKCWLIKVIHCGGKWWMTFLYFFIPWFRHWITNSQVVAGDYNWPPEDRDSLPRKMATFRSWANWGPSPPQALPSSGIIPKIFRYFSKVDQATLFGHSLHEFAVNNQIREQLETVLDRLACSWIQKAHIMLTKLSFNEKKVQNFKSLFFSTFLI